MPSKALVEGKLLTMYFTLSGSTAAFGAYRQRDGSLFRGAGARYRHCARRRGICSRKQRIAAAAQLINYGHFPN
jgi:hypothetical protein